MEDLSKSTSLGPVLKAECLNTDDGQFTNLVAASGDGRRILAGTSKGNLLVVRSGPQDNDSSNIKFDKETLDIGEWQVEALAYSKNDNVYIGADRNVIEYNFVSKQVIRTVFRGTLKIRRLALRPDNTENNPKWLAIASEELTGHTRSLRCISFSPDGKYLASACAFGSIRLWGLSSMSCVKNLYGLFPESESILSIDIHWSTSFLLTPGSAGCCFLIDTATWKYKKVEIKNKNYEPVIHVSVSPDESFFAISTSGNVLNVFGGNKRESIFCVHLNFQCRGLLWSNEGNLFMASETQIYYIHNNTFQDRIKTMISFKKLIKDAELISAPSPPLTIKKRLHSLFGTDSDIDDSAEYIPKHNKHNTGNLKDHSISNYDTSDFIIDDDGGGYKNSLGAGRDIDKYYDAGKKRALKIIDKAANVSRIGTRLDAKVSNFSYFQPGSTTRISDFCYLAFNATARVYRHYFGSNATINIDFHDKNYRPVKFEDHHQLYLASVSSIGAIFGCDGEFANTNSFLEFKSCSTNPDANDWMIEIKNGENVKLVAITGSGPVCVTDRNFIRFFSISGLQSFVQTIPHVPISMVGSNDYLFVIYHGMPYYYTLIDAVSKNTLSSGHLGISLGSKPLWLGFDEKQTPLVYDSKGYLHTLHPSTKCGWVPVLLIPKEFDPVDIYPIDVKEYKFYFLLKVFQDISFSVPSIGGLINNEKEERLLLQALKIDTEIFQNIRDPHRDNINVIKAKIEKDRVILELLLESLKNNDTTCVRDLCALINTDKALEGAEKMASLYKLYNLIDYIASLKIKRSQEHNMPPNNKTPKELDTPPSLT